MGQQFLYFLLICVIFFSCSEKNEKIIKDAEVIRLNINLTRLEDSLFGFQKKEDAAIFLKNNPDFVTEFLGQPYPIADSQFIDVFYDFYQNPELKEFYSTAKSEFGDFTSEKLELENMFRYVKYFYPEYQVPEIQTAVTGFRFDKDMAFSENAIIISYDYFLGAKAAHRPPFFEYFLKRYEKPYMIPMIALGISSQVNNADLKDESMLANMIYYGKAHYFVERVLPEIPDSLNIMYSSQELQETQDHLDVIWGHFIEKELLYNNTRFIVEKYCGERPNVLEIGDKCPGRIGRWLGWQIVRSYMKENPDVTLQDLMMEKDARKIFSLSKYKPAK